MEYDVVFKISLLQFFQEKSLYIFTLIPIVGFVIFRRFGTRKIQIYSSYFLTFGFLVIVTVANVGVFLQYLHALDVYEHKNYRVVEGVVEDFKPKKLFTKNKIERFSVNGVRFSYSDLIRNPGFRHSNAYGGPIREGLQVRISYMIINQALDKWILKLEIAKNKNAS